MDVKKGDIVSLSIAGEVNQYGIVLDVFPVFDTILVAFYFKGLNMFDTCTLNLNAFDGRNLRIMGSNDDIL